MKKFPEVWIREKGPVDYYPSSEFPMIFIKTKFFKNNSGKSWEGKKLYTPRLFNLPIVEHSKNGKTVKDRKLKKWEITKFILEGKINPSDLEEKTC